MQVIGVDLAAADSNTALAVLDKSSTGWRLSQLSCPASDHDIISAVEQMPHNGKAGFDCPLGWPSAFVDFVAKHQVRVADEIPDKISLMKRRTDLRVTELVADHTTPSIRLTPLSVSSDRIAVPAWRMAHLEQQLSADAHPDRSGSGSIVEVYPAAALAVWKLPHRGYKGRDGENVREKIVAGIDHRAGNLLDIDDFYAELCASDHLLDALISALVAVAVATGQCVTDSGPRSPEEEDLAGAEGWIWLPDPDLTQILR